MKAEDMLWEFLPEVLKGVFEVVRVDKTAARYDVYLDEKRVKSEADRRNGSRQGIYRGVRHTGPHDARTSHVPAYAEVQVARQGIGAYLLLLN